MTVTNNRSTNKKAYAHLILGPSIINMTLQAIEQPIQNHALIELKAGKYTGFYMIPRYNMQIWAHMARNGEKSWPKESSMKKSRCAWWCHWGVSPVKAWNFPRASSSAMSLRSTCTSSLTLDSLHVEWCRSRCFRIRVNLFVTSMLTSTLWVCMFILMHVVAARCFTMQEKAKYTKGSIQVKKWKLHNSKQC